MSLDSIISQLQSVNPYGGGGKVTPEAIASGITKTRNSVIRLAKLLQNSGRVSGSRYLPDQARSSNNARTQGKTLERVVRDMNKLSSDQSKLKAYTEQSVNNLKRQINSLKATINRNQNVIKSLQSELAFRRPQKELKKAMDSTNLKLQSFNKAMRAELRTLNRRIDELEKRQVRITQRLRDLETGAARAKDAGGAPSDIVGRRQTLNFKQRLDYVERIAQQAKLNALGSTMSIGGTDFTEGSREREERSREFLAGLGLTTAAVGFGAGAGLAGSKLQELFKRFAEDLKDGGTRVLEFLGLTKAQPTAGAPVIGPDGKPIITAGASPPKEVKDLLEKEKALSEAMASAKTPEEKQKYEAELEVLKKERLQKLMDAGIITSEHVAAGMATEEDVTFYKTETAEGIRYVDAAVVKEFPEIWKTSEAQPDIVVLEPDWQKTVESNPELKRRIEQKTEQLKGGATSGGKVRSIRNYNPGNLRYDPEYTGPGGVLENAIGQDADGFAIFANKEDGVDALIRQVNLDTQTRGKTLRQFIEKYAPLGDKDNDPEQYIQFITEKTGIKADEQVPKEKVKEVVEAIIQKEGYPEALETFQETVDALTSNVAPLPNQEDGAMVAASSEPSAVPEPQLFATTVKTPELKAEEVEAEVQKTEMVAENVERDDKINQALGMTLGQQQQMVAMATNLDKSLTVLGQKTNRALSMIDSGVTDYTVKNTRLNKYA